MEIQSTGSNSTTSGAPASAADLDMIKQLNDAMANMKNGGQQGTGGSAPNQAALLASMLQGSGLTPAQMEKLFRDLDQNGASASAKSQIEISEDGDTVKLNDDANTVITTRNETNDKGEEFMRIHIHYTNEKTGERERLAFIDNRYYLNSEPAHGNEDSGSFRNTMSFLIPGVKVTAHTEHQGINLKADSDLDKLTLIIGDEAVQIDRDGAKMVDKAEANTMEGRMLVTHAATPEGTAYFNDMKEVTMDGKLIDYSGDPHQILDQPFVLATAGSADVIKFNDLNNTTLRIFTDETDTGETFIRALLDYDNLTTGERERVNLWGKNGVIAVDPNIADPNDPAPMQRFGMKNDMTLVAPNGLKLNLDMETSVDDPNKGILKGITGFFGDQAFRVDAGAAANDTSVQVLRDSTKAQIIDGLVADGRTLVASNDPAQLYKEAIVDESGDVSVIDWKNDARHFNDEAFVVSTPHWKPDDHNEQIIRFNDKADTRLTVNDKDRNGTPLATLSYTNLETGERELLVLRQNRRLDYNPDTSTGKPFANAASQGIIDDTFSFVTDGRVKITFDADGGISGSFAGKAFEVTQDPTSMDLAVATIDDAEAHDRLRDDGMILVGRSNAQQVAGPDQAGALVAVTDIQRTRGIDEIGLAAAPAYRGDINVEPLINNNGQHNIRFQDGSFIFNDPALTSLTFGQQPDAFGGPGSPHMRISYLNPETRKLEALDITLDGHIHFDDDLNSEGDRILLGKLDGNTTIVTGTGAQFNLNFNPQTLGGGLDLNSVFVSFGDQAFDIQANGVREFSGNDVALRQSMLDRGRVLVSSLYTLDKSDVGFSELLSDFQFQYAGKNALGRIEQPAIDHLALESQHVNSEPGGHEITFASAVREMPVSQLGIANWMVDAPEVVGTERDGNGRAT